MVRCWWFKIPFVNVETLDPSGVPKNLERVDGDRHSHESWFIIALKKNRHRTWGVASRLAIYFHIGADMLLLDMLLLKHSTWFATSVCPCVVRWPRDPAKVQFIQFIQKKKLRSSLLFRSFQLSKSFTEIPQKTHLDDSVELTRTEMSTS